MIKYFLENSEEGREGKVLMRKECLNTSFPGFVCVCKYGIHREAKKKCFKRYINVCCKPIYINILQYSINV